MNVGIVTLPTDRSLAAGRAGPGGRGAGVRLPLPVATTPTSRLGARRPFWPAAYLPDDTTRLIDPFVGLAAAAARTTTIQLGTCIFLIAQRDPISTAKQVASLDHLSGGRFVFGIGYGWNVEEAADHGVEWATRRARIREYVAAMRALWTEEKASFHGRFVDFDEAWMWPKPARQPYPPVILGAGATRAVFEDVIGWAEGWLPVPCPRAHPRRRPRPAPAGRGQGPRPGQPHHHRRRAAAPIRPLFAPWVAIGVDDILCPSRRHR